MSFITENYMAIVTALLALSELLALTKLKSNSVFQLIVNTLKSFAPKSK